MQLGMIGLGRMGANMVRRLMQGRPRMRRVRHVAPRRWRSWPRRRPSAPRRWRISSRSSTKPRAVWLMVPAGVVDKTHRRSAAASRAGDILIDGGNSYYVDDIRRAKELDAQGHPLRRRRHQRRRLGPRARLLHDDRRRDRSRCSTSIRSSPRWRRARGDIPRTPGREKAGGTAEQGYLHCGPNGAGHFVKMVHNGIEYGMMAAYAEGLGILQGGQRRQADARRSMPKPRRCAIPSTTSTISICPTSPRSGGAAA